MEGEGKREGQRGERLDTEQFHMSSEIIGILTESDTD